MSRIGKKIINIPEKTEVSFSSGVLTIKGPNGSLVKRFKPDINITVGPKEITLSPVKQTLESKSLWGTYASHIMNMISGVNNPYIKKLIIEGVGYKSEVKGTNLVLALGFSHPVIVSIPTDLKITTDKNTISISGTDCEKVGQFAAEVRSLKKPEPYLGKGIRYSDEVIRRKQGKKAA